MSLLSTLHRFRLKTVRSFTYLRFRFGMAWTTARCAYGLQKSIELYLYDLTSKELFIPYPLTSVITLLDIQSTLRVSSHTSPEVLPMLSESFVASRQIQGLFLLVPQSAQDLTSPVTNADTKLLRKYRFRVHSQKFLKLEESVTRTSLPTSRPSRSCKWPDEASGVKATGAKLSSSTTSGTGSGGSTSNSSQSGS